MSRKLKIIIFDGSFKTTPFINRLVKGLAVKHQVYILGFNEKISQPVAEITYVSLGSNQSKLKFTVTTLGKLLQSKKFNLMFPTLRKLIEGKRQELQQQNLDLALKNISPDIIHLQWPSVIPWFEEVLLKQETPVVLSQRGFHSNVRPFVDEANFKYLKEWYPKMAGFHSVSNAISANGDKIWRSSKKIDKVVYTGLPLEEISFSQAYIVSKQLNILSIGRSHWKKGYDYALRCCKVLKEKNVHFHYTIIGGAGDEELQFLVNDLGLQDYVKLEGRKPQMEVFRLMREASVLLMPSLEEGIPNVVVEAMAIGLPVISTDCGGISELISDKMNGWIVPNRDPNAMADAIEAFSHLSLDNIEVVHVAARKKVELQHNGEQMLLGMEGLYYEVLERH
ncbi:glycosyltransferase family 4 protein [Aequorivita antarctica]|uniref:Glycosyltransferase n=1 Tax=Aequorivita antarctica TaxID=153266 RepID=A0A5C6YZF5_9FLAO|nr:glycosyltransferase family 4 protein [Aequorivita antarctica]TXD72489.1 glycosyltransferase [Aequorivita antarctica]SRX75623.1 Putative teichuronic acid biosynthesis glycosyltransferase TuaC [Aequorivita antarctica]